MTTTLPPNDFSGAIYAGAFGEIDPNTGYFRSVYYAKETLSTSLWSSIFYSFDSKGDYYLSFATREYPDFSSWLIIYNNDQQEEFNTRGPSYSEANYEEIASGHHYIESHMGSDKGNIVQYDLGFWVSPIDKSYSDNEQSDLGDNPNMQINGTMATVFERGLPTDPSAKEMKVLSTKLAEDQSDDFTFDITKAGTITITVSGEYSAAVLHVPSQGVGGQDTRYQFNGTKTLHVNPGEYTLTLYDTSSQVSMGGAGGGIVIRTGIENYDEYSVNFQFKEDAPMMNFDCSLYAPSSIKSGRVTDFQLFLYDNSTENYDVKVSFYLSTNNIITKSDRHLGNLTLDTGQWDHDLTIKLNAAPGRYYLGAMMDPDGAFGETTLDDNTAYDAVRVTKRGRVVSDNDDFGHSFVGVDAQHHMAPADDAMLLM